MGKIGGEQENQMAVVGGLSRIHQISMRAHDVDRAVRFYRDTLGLPLAQRPQPSGQLRQAGPIMVDHPLCNDLTVTVEHTHSMVLRAPINSHKPVVSDDMIIGLRWRDSRNNKTH